MSNAPPNALNANANLIPITSVEQFQATLSSDLTRISLINFWAPWAAPCTQMNAVVAELAKKHPALLVLNVEAEEQADIAESFDVEAVPSFVVLRGHTLLARISGADAPALTQAIAKHLSAPPAPAPSNKTPTQQPPSNETPEELEKRMRGLMNQRRVVLFMKGTPEEPRCGFSRKISTLLREHAVDFAHFDILSDEDVRQGLKKLNDWPTFPQLIVDGELVGGLDIVQEMIASHKGDSVARIRLLDNGREIPFGLRVTRAPTVARPDHMKVAQIDQKFSRIIMLHGMALQCLKS
ncbi:Monothiol glutaredoxin-4 [Mycena indigotica]|uniref:Monothiol glutaredoxin-4 n=1 Tax=Mycena indigotica TaxID=2126181 RepID=A0A8H6WIE2_9AGAR|nr:Monothiol glutaredoxin-4 [Mycena indigotica]KAF7316038.1 Monothiol glutaredoxin-4 [Mycena indigotica]